MYHGKESIGMSQEMDNSTTSGINASSGVDIRFGLCYDDCVGKYFVLFGTIAEEISTSEIGKVLVGYGIFSCHIISYMIKYNNTNIAQVNTRTRNTRTRKVIEEARAGGNRTW